MWHRICVYNWNRACECDARCVKTTNKHHRFIYKHQCQAVSSSVWCARWIATTVLVMLIYGPLAFVAFSACMRWEHCIVKRQISCPATREKWWWNSLEANSYGSANARTHVRFAASSLDVVFVSALSWIVVRFCIIRRNEVKLRTTQTISTSCSN